jgi:hypothetical protein
MNNLLIKIILLLSTTVSSLQINFSDLNLINNNNFNLKELRSFVASNYHTNEALDYYKKSRFLIEENTRIEILLKNERFVFIPPQPVLGFLVPYVIKFPSGRYKKFNENNKKYLFLGDNATSISQEYDNIIYDYIQKNITDDRAVYNSSFSIVADKLDLPIISPRFAWQCVGTNEDDTLNQTLDRDSVLFTMNDKDKHYIKRCLSDEILGIPLKDNEFASIIDVEKQVFSILEHAKNLLKKFDYPVEEKIITMGFSNSGVFAQRFATIYPEIIKAYYAGGFVFPIVPSSTYNGVNLTYPIGTYEHEEIFGKKFNLEEYNKIAKINATGAREYIFSGVDKHSRPTLEFLFNAPNDWSNDKKRTGFPLIWNKYVDAFYASGAKGMHLMNAYSYHYLTDNDVDFIIDFFRMNLNSETAVYPLSSPFPEHKLRVD